MGQACLGIDRRAVLAGCGAVVAATLVPRTGWGRTSQGSVFCHHPVAHAEEAQSLLQALRRAQGCVRVKVLGTENGDLSIWQEWRSQEDLHAHWSGSARPTRRFEKLSL